MVRPVSLRLNPRARIQLQCLHKDVCISNYQHLYMCIPYSIQNIYPLDFGNALELVTAPGSTFVLPMNRETDRDRTSFTHSFDIWHQDTFNRNRIASLFVFNRP